MLITAKDINSVRKLAKRRAFMGNPHLDFQAMFSAGMLGLVKAQGGFDPKRGHRFITYAGPRALGEMRDLHRNETSRNRHNVAADSLDFPSGTDRASIHEIVGDATATNPMRSVESDDSFEAMIRHLPRREYMLMRLRYKAGMSAKETAAALGISPSLTSQIERRLLAALKARLTSRGPR